MPDRKLFIGTPVADGKLWLNYVISLIVTIRESIANGWGEPEYYFRACDSDLARARNVIVSKFLESKCTDLLLIDSDISWCPGTITRMMSHKKDFVCGPYRGKTDDKDIYFILWPEKKEMHTDPETGFPLLKVDGMPIGFARLTRECVEKLVKPYEGRWMQDPMCKEEQFPWLIDFEKFGDTRYEEGYSLCKKWQAMGGDCWVDPGIGLGHMGAKIFESNLISFLEKMQSISRFNEPSESQKRIEDAWMHGAPRVAAE